MVLEIKKRREHPLLILHKFFRKYRQAPYIGRSIGFIYKNILFIYVFSVTLTLATLVAIAEREDLKTAKLKLQNLIPSAYNIDLILPPFISITSLHAILLFKVVCNLAEGFPLSDEALRISHYPPHLAELFKKIRSVVVRKEFLNLIQDPNGNVPTICKELEKNLVKARSLSDCKVISTQFEEDYKILKYRSSSSPVELANLKIIKTFVNRAIRFLKEHIELFYLSTVSNPEKNGGFFLNRLCLFGSYSQMNILCHILGISIEDKENVRELENRIDESFAKIQSICARVEKNKKLSIEREKL